LTRYGHSRLSPLTHRVSLISLLCSGTVRSRTILFHGGYITPQSSLTRPSLLLTAASNFDTAKTTGSRWRVSMGIQPVSPAHPQDRRPNSMSPEHQSLLRPGKQPPRNPLRQGRGRPSLPLRAWKMDLSISARRLRMCWPCKSFS
jgi:hypothetical protein